MENKTYTKRAFITLLIPTVMIAFCYALYETVAHILTALSEIEFIMLFLMMCYLAVPFVAIVCGIKSISLGIKAIKLNEPKAVSVIMIILSAAILVCGAVFLFTLIKEIYVFWFAPAPI